MKQVLLGSVPIGAGAPTVLCAEIGTFFNRDIGLAGEYLQQVAAAGVPVFKTEILHNADVCLRDTGLNCKFAHASGVMLEDYRRLIERKTVPLAQYAQLFAKCRELGLPFIASIYDFEGIDFLVKEGGAGIKIARHNIDHYPLIRHAAKTGLPLIFDAGVVYAHEISRALEVARAEGNLSLIVNHHPGPSPAPASAHNLRVIETYKRMFDVPIGLSCHYRGDEILYAAVGCGVDFIEKGAVEDPDRVEQEVVSATRLADLKSVVAKLRASWEALGSAKEPSVKEPRDLSVRKGLVALRPIQAGEALTLENVGFAWPPLGIPVAAWDFVAGQSAGRAFELNQPIHWSDVRFNQPA
jgi:sialic acid synthase SpsE